MCKYIDYGKRKINLPTWRTWVRQQNFIKKLACKTFTTESYHIQEAMRGFIDRRK